MSFTLRPYCPDSDFEGMFTITREIISLPPYEAAREELASYPDREMIALVAVDNAEIIGFCAATYPYWNAVAMIDYLVVTPSYRGQGVGRKLVTALESRFREVNLRVSTVTTASWNKGGIRFYESLGYVERGVFREYFGEGNDVVWLERWLT